MYDDAPPTARTSTQKAGGRRQPAIAAFCFLLSAFFPVRGRVPVAPRIQPEVLLHLLDQLGGKLALGAGEADPRLRPIAVSDEVAEQPGKVLVESSRKPKL